MTVISVCRSLTQTATPLMGRVLKPNVFRFANQLLTTAISQPFAVRTHSMLKGRVVLKEKERHGLTLGFYALGGFLLTALIMQEVTDCKGNKRIMTLGVLPANPKLKQVPYGLIRDPEHEGWYKIEDKPCRFRVQLTANGQLIWRSFDAVEANDVKAVANFYKEKGCKGRSLHVNTGIHAIDATGLVIVDDQSSKFGEEDMVSFRDYLPVALHLVSSYSGPQFTPARTPDVDILDAWSFSACFRLKNR